MPLIKAAVDQKLPIITEIELASEDRWCWVIAVTGSNGKTTTTTMITKMMNQERSAGKSTYAGNVN